MCFVYAPSITSLCSQEFIIFCFAIYQKLVIFLLQNQPNNCNENDITRAGSHQSEIRCPKVIRSDVCDERAEIAECNDLISDMQRLNDSVSEITQYAKSLADCSTYLTVSVADQA